MQVIDHLVKTIRAKMLIIAFDAMFSLSLSLSCPLPSPLINRFVNSFGYVSLFPFLLKLVSPSSEQLGSTLDRLANKSVSHMTSKNDQATPSLIFYC